MNPKLKALLIGEFSWRRVMTSLLLIPICVYVGLLIIAVFFSDKVIFRPQPVSYKHDTEIIKLKTPDGKSIAAKFYENPGAKYTILFSHGNAEDIGTIEPFIWQLRDIGFSVISYDYSGYGLSDGAPSEENTYVDIETVYDYLITAKNIPPDRIILHGRSLGGGPSVDLAARKPVTGLILESTFDSTFRVITKVKLIPFDKFSNIDKIRNVHCPVLSIHGTADWTMPFNRGEKLFAAANEPKTFLRVDGAGHNNVFNFASSGYTNAIRNFAASLEN